MPPRDNPTARQARLGGELRKLRDRAGKTAREAAGLLSTDQAKISHIESGRNGISEERIRKLAVFYGCDDAELIEALCAIAREHRGQYWWDEYRGVLPPSFLDIAELEHHAQYLRYLQPVTFPGVLQTEDHARALFDSGRPKLPANEVQARLEHRMKRRSILDRENPPEVEAVVHEAALRMRIGGRKVARQQLDHLIKMSERPEVMLRIIPFTNEDFIDLTRTVLYAGGAIPQLDSVHIDSRYGGLFLDAVTELENNRTLLDFAEQASLEPDESRSFIHHIAREL
ncbi:MULTISPECIES: helix-turn-helix transcriptional regulator [unclassified Streptomyces]|uniref:helix-turn-helix domain-containing protein n=1 Tax=unclassified Streptomyces TaxID=2593676 RepID=UPI00081D5FF1|nr:MULTISPECIES: helix-turn-helix transcriptional regulator [unclassified Streptomyces]MYZ39700.1 helix-turn-helix domain-containing protein [Streptomyces sp. SID4917]SCG04878.1 Helix-turn-helix domain-containing protein [Streptomyces sp. MnatMP-M17]